MAALAKLKFVVLGAAAGGIALVGVDAALPAPVPVPVVQTPVAVVDSAGNPAPRRVPTPAPTVKHAAATVPVVVANPVPEPTTPAPAPMQAPPRRRASKTPSKADVQPAAAASSPTPELGDEMPMLTQARKALGAGQANQALALVREHADRFPSSKLSDLRAVIEVEALCATGNRAKARQMAEAFVARHPGAAAAAKLERACAG
jgi:hypothetical protein